MRRVLLSFITLFLILVGREAYGQCPSPTTISTPGNGSWPVPSGVTSITVEVWGAGGAGGVAGSNPSAGGGGSGGGYVRTNLSVTPGSSINYFVGSGGSGASGSDGQSSWFQTNSSIFAVGGRGAGTSSGIGTGALAVTSGNLGGTLASWYGGAGGNTNGTTTSGGGGASAGTSGNGNPASGSTGGTSTNGSTVGPNGVSGTSNGNSGNSPGSGGSGGIRNSGSSRNGGNGGNGRIIITVNPSAVGAISANQAICSGSSPSNLTVASATGTIQWQRADDLAFTANVTNVGTNSTTLTS
ncbi:glycine-rich domain-containing protein, partial [Algoriphagus aestuariicola]